MSPSQEERDAGGEPRDFPPPTTVDESETAGKVIDLMAVLIESLKKEKESSRPSQETEST